MNQIDFEGLAGALLSRIRDLVPAWLPGGKLIGHEYSCASLLGGRGDSCKVNINTGLWADFASNEKGGDLISLHAAINHIKQSESAKILSEQIGYSLNLDVPRGTSNNQNNGSTETISEIESLHEQFLFEMQGQSACTEQEILSALSSRLYAWLEKKPSFNGSPEIQRQLPELCRRLQETGKVDSEILRRLWQFAFPNAPSGLHQAPSGGVALQKMSSEASRNLINSSPQSLVAPPDTAVNPLMVHGQFGKPTASWEYRDAGGQRLFFVARYDTPDGKQFLPWSYNGKTWVCKAWPAPRPLFGLPELVAQPNKPVLIVEGEKTCEAARAIAGNAYIVVTWPNGSKAVSKADWSALKGRKVLIWPDADAPGIEAGNAIAEILHKQSPEVKIIDAFDRSDGWDAADALKEGWDWNKFKAWAKPIVRVFGVNVNVTVQTESDNGPVTESCYALWERLGLPQQSNGQPIVNEDCAIRVFDGLPQFKDKIWFDEFHQKQFTTWMSPNNHPREWRDIDDLTLCTIFQRDFGLRKMSDVVIKKAVRVYAHSRIRNEPRDWMNSLTWDKTPRIEGFFKSCMGAEDTAYVRGASRNFWLTMVARILFPGCKVDNMIILKGEQGKFKSTALTAIGGDWYSEAHESVTSKDFYMILHGNLLIEISELDAFNRAENNTIKKVVSCAKDRYRPPYGTRAENFPRQCVFVGTTNEDQPLKDYTGGRRFWPINVGEVNVREIQNQREQLFAEAVAILKSENPKYHADRDVSAWWKMPYDETLAVQDSNRQSDEWEDIILTFLENRASTEITIPQLAKDCLFIGADRLDKAIQMRIARNLVAVGWKRNVVRKGDKILKIWHKKPVTTSCGYEF